MTKYTIRSGDTLSGIAARFGVSVDELARLNGIKNKDLIRAGKTLLIPIEAEEQTPAKEPENLTLGAALDACLDALEKLPEYKRLAALLDEMEG